MKHSQSIVTGTAYWLVSFGCTQAESTGAFDLDELEKEFWFGSESEFESETTDNCDVCKGVELARFELEKLGRRLELDEFERGAELADEPNVLELRFAFSDVPPMELKDEDALSDLAFIFA